MSQVSGVHPILLARSNSSPLGFRLLLKKQADRPFSVQSN
jgi:hypothetical protein